jgi:predicted  nucleic acid-binding Zn-ribbon protein
MKFAILLLSIAISGVASYYTLTQTEKFQEIQTARTDSIDTKERVDASINKQLADIEVKQGELKQAQDELAGTQARVSDFKLDNNAIQNQAAGLDAKVSAQQTQLEELTQVVSGVKDELSSLNIDITLGTLNDGFKGLETSIQEREKKDKGLDETITTEEKRLVDKRAEIDRYNGRIQARDLRIAQNEVEARVTAVNHDWGFLVIGAGSNSGFAPDTSLLIKREGRLIATVRPSAIEPTQTIADIDFKTLSPGVRIQRGDEVMLAKPSPN